MSDAKKHNLYLTWARGIAAFLVIVSHSLRASQSVYSPADSKAESFLFRFLDLGDFGVSLFFALSGCTLYLSSARIKTRTEIGNFYIKRLARVWPTFFVSILVYMALSAVFRSFYTSPKGLWIEFILKDWTIRDLLAYMAFVSDFTGPMYLFNNAYWSLPIEFQFYLIFPILLILLRTTTFYGPLILGMSLYVIGLFQPFEFADYRFFTMAYMFVGGMLCAHYYQRIEFKLTPIHGTILLLILLLMVSGVRNEYIPLPQIPVILDKFTWYGLASVAVILIALIIDSKKAEFSRVDDFLTLYGDISYSTYLYHNIFIALCVLCVLKFEITGQSKLFFIFFFTVIGTYWLARVSYRFVEKPYMDLARKWVRQRYATEKLAQ